MNKKKIVSRFLYSQKVAPYVFILPFLLTFSIFFAYPVVNTVAMSFQKVSGGNTFVGLKNYRQLMNPAFIKAVKNSVFIQLSPSA